VSGYPQDLFGTSTAVIDGPYRYRLSRIWNETKPRLGWVMLNPSTADENTDDPTIRKCCGFATRNGYGGIEVFNLFALRSTYPAALIGAPNPVGPRTDEYIASGLTDTPDVVLAWGGWPIWKIQSGRDSQIVDLLKRCRLFCLGTTKSGAPLHPLYVPYSRPLLLWPSLQERNPSWTTSRA